MPSGLTTIEKDGNDKIVVRCGPFRKLLIRPETYQDALKLVSDAFTLPEKMPQMVFSAKLGRPDAKIKDTRQEDFAPISEHNWASSRGQVKILRVVKQPKVEKPAAASEELTDKTADCTRTIKVVHESYGRKYEIKATSPLQDVFRAFSISVSVPLEDLKFYYQARALEPSDTPSSLKLPHTTTLSATRYYVTLVVWRSTGETIRFRVKHSPSMAKIYDAVKIQAWNSDGVWINPGLTAGEVFSMGCTEIDCTIEQVGGKPVIYLFPPQPLQATVRLSLEPSWKFDAVYPISPIQDDPQSGWQSIKWEVDATPEGNIRDKESGMEVTYLFWEAKTTPKPHRAAMVASEAFVPGQTRCQPENSVLLPVQRITQYLDHTLSLLGLHISSRTNFVTYWLPRFLQHKHIALRFVSQEAYEEAAPLDISPQPDVVTRIFMLFQGVTVAEVTTWAEAEARATEDAVFWKNVVGIDPDKQQDRSLFRVWEWGGMEVYGESRLITFSDGRINLE
ncbi:hypothetical protein FRC04_008970 [Tulasnella sp. 424]|nr:hypothetical protein FRC04_008970 [Tulasnella sp. 424]KAG8973626.1 hypothetical protein FRC05_008562 [Tulasnella sp. 425]